MASQGKRMVPEALIKKLQDFSNNGLAALTAGNITTLTTNQINSLKCGDIVCKEDSTGKHAYIVSYKKDGTGICLTYADASVVETVSYDYSGSAWVYNSTDITPIKNVVANPTLAGTEANLTGLQVGDTKYAMPKLYALTFNISDTYLTFIVRKSSGLNGIVMNSNEDTTCTMTENQIKSLYYSLDTALTDGNGYLLNSIVSDTGSGYASYSNTSDIIFNDSNNNYNFEFSVNESSISINECSSMPITIYEKQIF